MFRTSIPSGHCAQQARKVRKTPIARTRDRHLRPRTHEDHVANERSDCADEVAGDVSPRGGATDHDPEHAVRAQPERLREPEVLAELDEASEEEDAGGEAGTVELEISDNLALLNLRALSKLTRASSLSVLNNSNLPTCEAYWLRDHLSSVDFVAIEGNDDLGVCAQ